jgi:hypothetical protein
MSHLWYLEVQESANPVVERIVALLRCRVSTRCGVELSTSDDVSHRLKLALAPGPGSEGFRIEDDPHGGLVVSLAMFRASSFSRLTARVGALAYGLSLGNYLRQALTTSVAIALLLILPGALLIVVWYSLVGRRLPQLGRHGG